MGKRLTGKVRGGVEGRKFQEALERLRRNARVVRIG